MIKIAKTAGFCFGVTRAINLTLEAAEKYGKAFTYGPLIHNNDVIVELSAKGISVTDTLEAKFIPVIIRSHGVAESVYDELREKELEYIDATCPFVEKIHKRHSYIRYFQVNFLLELTKIPLNKQ